MFHPVIFEYGSTLACFKRLNLSNADRNAKVMSSGRSGFRLCKWILSLPGRVPRVSQCFTGTGFSNPAFNFTGGKAEKSFELPAELGGTVVTRFHGRLSNIESVQHQAIGVVKP